MVRILVVIVTYNGMKWLDKTFKSLRESSLPVDVYIVDNGSTDNSGDYIKQNFPEATFIQSETNLGFGAANNLGLMYAIEQDYDYVYLLNQDAWILPDTLQCMITAHQNNPSYGILSPLQTNAAMDKLDNLFEGHYKQINDVENRSKTEQVLDIEFSMAAHWLISRDCLRVVGLFSPVFFHYGEDNNYINRAQYFNFGIGVVPRAIGVHDREFRVVSVQTATYHLATRYLYKISNINLHTPFPLLVVKAYLSYINKARKMCFRHRNLPMFFRARKYIVPLKQISQDRARNRLPYNKG